MLDPNTPRSTAPGPRGTLHVGTSGWAYDWPEFYPPGVAPEAKLAHYVTRFASVEVNSTFYRLPRAATCARWRERTPRGFVATLKLSRSITHERRLRGVEGDLERFLGAAAWLGPKLGAILVQLPPSFAADVPLLDGFLGALARRAGRAGVRLRAAFEPRHPSWFGDPGVAATLRAHGAALAFAHSSRFPYASDEPLTAPFRYLRFHGPRELCASEYGEELLAPWAARAAAWLDGGADVYAYFNNDVDGHAPRDAARLARLVEGARSGQREGT